MPEEDDDLLPALPELGGLGEDEPFGDDDLGLDDEAGVADERVGLDDSVGFDDEPTLFALELPPEEAVTDEEIDPIPVEGLDGDDEYGWTDDGRGEDDAWDDGVDLPGLTPLAGDDGGEEGVDELADLGLRGDEVPHLPPLRERGVPDEDDEDADDLALGEDGSIEELADARGLPARLEGCRVEHLGPSGVVTCFEPGPPALAAGADGIFAVGERCAPMPTRGIDDAIVSIAASGSRVVVGTRRSGALRSEDGVSFAPANAWAEGREVGQALTLAREHGADRLWALTAGGALFRSDDFGASWAGPLILKTVVAIATPPEGGVIALSGGRDAPQLARSDDGGRRWSAVDAPPLGSGPHHVRALRDCVAVASELDRGGPFLSGDRGKSWARMPGLPPAGPIALAWEPGGLTVYAAHVIEDRAVVVRHRPGGGEAALVLDGAEHGAFAEARVLAMEAAREADATVLHVATTRGLFRAWVRPERAP